MGKAAVVKFLPRERREKEKGKKSQIEGKSFRRSDLLNDRVVHIWKTCLKQYGEIFRLLRSGFWN